MKANSSFKLLVLIFLILSDCVIAQKIYNPVSGVSFTVEEIKLKLPHDFQARLEYASSEKKVHQLTGQRIDSLNALVSECRNLMISAGWKKNGGEIAASNADIFSSRFPISLFLSVDPQLTYSKIDRNVKSDLWMPVRDKSLFETAKVPTPEHRISAEEQIRLMSLDDDVYNELIKLWIASAKDFSTMVNELKNGKIIPHTVGKNYARSYCYECSNLTPKECSYSKCTTEEIEEWRQSSSITYWKNELLDYVAWTERFNDLLDTMFRQYWNLKYKGLSQMTTEYTFIGEDAQRNYYANRIRLSRKDRMLQRCKGENGLVQTPIYTFEYAQAPVEDSTTVQSMFHLFEKDKQIRNTYSAGLLCGNKWKGFNRIETPAIAMEVFKNDQIVIKNKDVVEGSVTTYIDEASKSLLIAFNFSDLLKDLQPELASIPSAEKYTLRNDTVYLKKYMTDKIPAEYLRDGDVGMPFYLFGKSNTGEFTVMNMQRQYHYLNQLKTCTQKFSTDNWFECMLVKQLQECYATHSTNKKNLESVISNINYAKYVDKLKQWDAKVKACDYCKKDYSGTPYTYKRNSYGTCDGFDRIVGGCPPFMKGGNCCSPKCAHDLCGFDE